MAAVDGVDDVLRERFQFLEIDGDDEFVAAVDPAAVEPARAEGDRRLRGPRRPRRSCCRRRYADDIGIAVGDTLDITVSRPVDRTGRSRASSRTTRSSSAGVVTTIDTFEASGFEPADNALIVFAEDGPAADGLQERLDAIVEELPIVTVKDQQAFATGAARAHRPVRAHHLRAARPGPDHRGARHRQHAGPLDHRAHPRGRAAARDRAEPATAAPDDPAGVGGDLPARRRARAWPWASSSAWC